MHAQRPLRALARRADRLARDDHGDRIRVQLRELPDAIQLLRSTGTGELERVLRARPPAPRGSPRRGR